MFKTALKKLDVGYFVSERLSDRAVESLVSLKTEDEIKFLDFFTSDLWPYLLTITREHFLKGHAKTKDRKFVTKSCLFL